MIELLTPTRHSNVVGGSSAARVLACPASIRLNQAMPEQGESTFAAEGTALHNCVEHCLTHGLFSGDTDGLVGETFYDVVMTRDHIDTCINPALDMFDVIYTEMEAEGGEGSVLYKMETEVQLEGLEDAFGTADIIMTNGHRAAIIDWKFGGGIPVDAFENKQMSYYASGAATSAPECFWPAGEAANRPHDWPVTCYIVQPRIDADEPSRWDTDYGYIEQFRLDLIDAVNEGLSHDADPTFKRGDHCRWCRATAVCPAYKKIGEAVAARLELSGETVVQPMGITPDKLAEWLARAEICEFWAKSVRKLALEEAEAGRPPSGMKLVEKLGNTAYVLEENEQIDRMLERCGLKVADRRKVVPVTPTQANKKLKALGKKVLTDQQARRFVTGTALVDVSDKRPAIETTADKAKKLQIALEGAK